MLSPVTLPVLFALAAVILVLVSIPPIPMRRQRGGTSSFPLVTLSLIALNVVLFLATTGANGLPPEVAQHWGMIPRAANLLTLVTHLFLHNSWGHLLGNMLGLWLFGQHVEEALGRLEYALFYLGSGVAAGLLHLIIAATVVTSAAEVPLIGASGAVFGILGLFAVRFWRARVRLFVFLEVSAVWAVASWVVLNLCLSGLVSLLTGRSDSIAHFAHIGGLAFGVLMTMPLRMREDSRREYHLEDAEKAVASGNSEMAAAHYRQVVAHSPEDANAHHALARVYVTLRQAEAAHRHMLDALKLNLAQGHSLAVARVYEDAVSCFENFPLTPILLQRVASACEETEQYSLAVRALSELCRDHPAAREAEMSLLRLGKLHLYKLNQPQNAEGIFSEFLRLYPDSDWGNHALRLREEANRAAVAFHPLPVRGN
ncbi:MAG: rhomboid family intramembrane serine protease [Capsulimonadales bacterium]|nr:rhomboid family intramembrane serine protease [Capsulimonadales bacterium]